MRVQDLPVWEKPREKLLRDGASRLTNAELLALLLRTGTADKPVMELAAEILSLNGNGLRYLTECCPEDLRKVRGLGDAKICTLLVAAELGRRIASTQSEAKERICGSGDIVNLYMEKVRYYRQEHFFCLLFDSRGGIIEEKEVSVGDLNSAQANPREVFAGAIRRNASSVAFIHNHPSGDPTPSQADLATTRRLVDAGNLLGIPVIDHIIIGDGTYVSFKEEGTL